MIDAEFRRLVSVHAAAEGHQVADYIRTQLRQVTDATGQRRARMHLLLCPRNHRDQIRVP